MQILSGEAFQTLLLSPDFHFKTEYLKLLKDKASEMLNQWSSDILEVWTEVFALTLAKLVKRDGDTKHCLDCKQVTVKMNDKNQAIKVRIKGALLLGFVAKYDSLGSPDLFEEYFLSEKSRNRLILTIC